MSMTCNDKKGNLYPDIKKKQVEHTVISITHAFSNKPFCEEGGLYYVIIKHHQVPKPKLVSRGIK